MADRSRTYTCVPQKNALNPKNPKPEVGTNFWAALVPIFFYYDSSIFFPSRFPANWSRWGVSFDGAGTNILPVGASTNWSQLSSNSNQLLQLRSNHPSTNWNQLEWVRPTIFCPATFWHFFEIKTLKSLNFYTKFDKTIEKIGIFNLFQNFDQKYKIVIFFESFGGKSAPKQL